MNRLLKIRENYQRLISHLTLRNHTWGYASLISLCGFQILQWWNLAYEPDRIYKWIDLSISTFRISHYIKLFKISLRRTAVPYCILIYFLLLIWYQYSFRHTNRQLSYRVSCLFYFLRNNYLGLSWNRSLRYKSILPWFTACCLKMLIHQKVVTIASTIRWL